jgi:hypothetical protein
MEQRKRMANSNPNLTIINLLNEELQRFLNNYESEELEDKTFIFTQDIAKYEKKITGNEIFLLTKFSNGTLGYDTQYIPATINVLSNINDIQAIKTCLNIFANTYNLNKSVIGTTYVIQSFSYCENISNFNNMGTSYHNILYMNAGFSVAEDISTISSIKYENEDLAFINARFSYSGSNDSKSLPNVGKVNAYGKSIIQYGTIALTITMRFRLSSSLILKCLSISNISGTDSQDNDFNMQVTFDTSTTFSYPKMKLLGFYIQQDRDSAPVCEFSFTL